jgi:hypothetical protein
MTASWHGRIRRISRSTFDLRRLRSQARRRHRSKLKAARRFRSASARVRSLTDPRLKRQRPMRRHPDASNALELALPTRSRAGDSQAGRPERWRWMGHQSPRDDCFPTEREPAPCRTSVLPLSRTARRRRSGRHSHPWASGSRRHPALARRWLTAASEQKPGGRIARRPPRGSSARVDALATLPLGDREQQRARDSRGSARADRHVSLRRWRRM